MSRYNVTAHSAAEAHVIFTLLTTTATWPAWTPIDTAEVVDGEPNEPERVGTVRVYHTGRHVSREQIVELVTDRRFSYEVLSGSFRYYRGTVALTPTADGTDIRWHATFRPKVPGTGWLWKLYLTWFMARCAHGLAAHAASLQRAT